MKANKKGFTLIELLVVIAIIGILAASLFGPITGAMLDAKMTATMANGTKIIKAIMQADMSGMNAGYVWPTTKASSTEADNTGTDFIDMASRNACNNSADYFTLVLNIANRSKATYDKFKILQGLDVDVLTGDGTAPFKNGSKLEENNVMWTIGANISDNAPGSLPVLVSRNVEANSLLIKYDGSKNAEIKLGTTYAKPFGDAGFVAISKDGSGTKVKGAEAFTRSVYKGGFDLSEQKVNDNSFTYLTPKTAVAPGNG